MNILKILFKITEQFLFVIIFLIFSTSVSEALDKFNKADNIADFFSGILLLNQSKYDESYKFLKRLNGLEKTHINFSSKYLYSMVNSGNFKKAYNYSKKLEKEKKNSFESDFIMAIYYLKNSEYELSNKYFFKSKSKSSLNILDGYIADSLYVWSNFNNQELDKAKSSLEKLDSRFENLKKLQNVFLHCFFKSNKTELLFDKLTLNYNSDFSRYSYFYAKYLNEKNKNKKALKVIKESIKRNPRNLLLNQYKIDLENSSKNFNFDCEKIEHVVAEILYIGANAYSSQSIYPQSNFYLSLSKYLNEKFRTYDTLMAENFYKIEDYSIAKSIYKKMISHGSAFKWYSNKQIAKILLKENKKEQALKLLNKSYNELKLKGIYETFDYAEFLKNNEEFEKSIKYYTDIINKIDRDHPLYPEVTDGRGVAYEREGNWQDAEKDFLNSLEVSPDQAYVINYLAYSWIEQGVKIKESLEMLKKANTLRSNDPFIIDSLGWALFKLERYNESKNYLQTAVKLLPADPIVNDHYGDVLWKIGKKIQARYYWNYVLNLKKTDEILKKKIEKKLIKGL